MKFFEIIIFLSINYIHFSSSAVTLECDFQIWSWQNVLDSYHCEVTNDLNIYSKYSAQVGEVKGTHMTEKGNENVSSLKIYDKAVHFFPKGIEKFFGNLETIFIEYGRLKRIQQSDLKPFPRLKTLIVGHNDISVLDDDLFQYNPDLKFLSIHHNQLIYVGQNTFENLFELNDLWIDGNPCTDVTTYNSSLSVIKAVKKVIKSCYDRKFSVMYQKVKGIEKSSKAYANALTNHDAVENNSNIYGLVTNLANKINKIEEDLKSLSSNLENRLNEILTKIDNLDLASKCNT